MNIPKVSEQRVSDIVRSSVCNCENENSKIEKSCNNVARSLFEPIINNIPYLPVIIFDNNENLYITSDGVPNKLLKYNSLLNSQYNLENGVSDSAWVFGPKNRPTTPVAMAFDINFLYLYVVNFSSSTITVINTNDYSYKNLELFVINSRGKNSPPPKKKGYRLSIPNGMTFDSEKKYLIVTNILDRNLVKIVINPKNPYMGIISPFNPDVPFTEPILVTNDNEIPNNFYVSDLFSSRVYKVSSNEYSIFAQSPDVYRPRGVSFNPNDDSKLWITNSNSDVAIISIDVKTLEVKNKINSRLFNNPRCILFDKNNYMYVSNFGSKNKIGGVLKSKSAIVKNKKKDTTKYSLKNTPIIFKNI